MSFNCISLLFSITTYEIETEHGNRKKRHVSTRATNIRTTNERKERRKATILLSALFLSEILAKHANEDLSSHEHCLAFSV
jgi:hypothetical protein